MGKELVAGKRGLATDPAWGRRREAKVGPRRGRRGHGESTAGSVVESHTVGWWRPDPAVEDALGAISGG